MSRGTGSRKKLLASCEPGSLIGEVALLVPTKRRGTAAATRLSDVMEINRALITRMLNEYPQVALRMRSALSERLTATVAELGKVKQSLGKVGQPPRR